MHLSIQAKNIFKNALSVNALGENVKKIDKLFEAIKIKLIKREKETQCKITWEI